MEKLEQMKECLVGMVESQIYGNIDKVDAQELGAAVDMIKDLAEAIYYCTITKAMEEGEEEDEDKKGKHHMMYYTRPMTMYNAPYPVEMYDPRNRPRYYDDIMYASNGGSNASGNRGGNRGGGSSSNGGSTMYHEPYPYVEYPEQVGHIYRDGMMKDPHEGKSGQRRKMYMDGKGVKDKTKQMQELEAYMQELANDMTEMIQDASPEEKMLLQNKISALAAKIK